MATPGWVYIVGHPRMRRAIKIGGTTRPPQARLAELSSGSVPEKFHLHFAVYTRDWRGLEKALHDALQEHRYPKSEWFAVSPRRAKRCLEHTRWRAAPARFLTLRQWLVWIVLRPLVVPCQWLVAGVRHAARAALSLVLFAAFGVSK